MRKISVALRKIVWRFARDGFNAKVEFPNHPSGYRTGQFSEQEYTPTSYKGIAVDKERFGTAKEQTFSQKG